MCFGSNSNYQILSYAITEQPLWSIFRFTVCISAVTQSIRFCLIQLPYWTVFVVFQIHSKCFGNDSNDQILSDTITVLSSVCGIFSDLQQVFRQWLKLSDFVWYNYRIEQSLWYIFRSTASVSAMTQIIRFCLIQLPYWAVFVVYFQIYSKCFGNDSNDQILSDTITVLSSVCGVFSDPQWACLTLGLFVCLDCAGIHRVLSLRVKSIKLDNWDREQVDVCLLQVCIILFLNILDNELQHIFIGVIYFKMFGYEKKHSRTLLQNNLVHL